MVSCPGLPRPRQSVEFGRHGALWCARPSAGCSECQSYKDLGRYLSGFELDSSGTVGVPRVFLYVYPKCLPSEWLRPLHFFGSPVIVSARTSAVET